MTNQKARSARLEQDNNECQLSKMFGIAALSGAPCQLRMEVHHIAYERYGKEEPEDLITVCKRCHEFLTSYIRELRYGRRNSALTAEPIAPKLLPITIERKKRNEDIEFQDYRSRTADYAQRTISRPSQQMDEDDLRDLFQARQD